MRFVTAEAAISSCRAAAARLPASATATNVLRFSIPSMILREIRIVTALIDRFSSAPLLTTVRSAPTTDFKNRGHLQIFLPTKARLSSNLSHGRFDGHGLE